jgi:GTPase Era involved in 16S rRNA processing
MLVDTGGFLPAAAEGREALVRRQAETAIGLASVVVFMVDAKTGATDLDRAIARNLRRSGKSCLLVVNKVDRPGDPVVHEFHRLGSASRFRSRPRTATASVICSTRSSPRCPPRSRRHPTSRGASRSSAGRTSASRRS